MTNFSQENQEIINDINKKLDKTDRAKLARVFETHNPDPLDSLLDLIDQEPNNLMVDSEPVSYEYTPEDQEEFDIMREKLNQELEPIDINPNPEKLDLDELSDILAASNIIDTTNHAGMLIHSISHPKLGKVTTVQADNGALLFRYL